jgi:predicted transcriptional regulator/gamma-glutamyl:cysteine ligase YbdK (ATP-grasp superfamily)
MGMQTSSSTTGATLKKNFTRQLINDLNAFEQMVKNGQFEKGITRIGVEQEFCLMDYNQRPSMKALEVLELLDGDQFTTELALFNLEANLNPLTFSGRCLTDLENQLVRLLTKANKVAHSVGAKIILTGILPTLRLDDIKIENISPNPRYKQLNDAMLESRGSDFTFHIHGVDELVHKHDSVLFESCNTSFQVHYQVQPEEAISSYNWAHAIAGPVLSSMANSPVFLGKRLWHETRIALFQQATDTRKSMSPLRKERNRVRFGSNWSTGDVIDIYREAVGRFEILMPIEVEEDAMKMLKANQIPKLQALAAHNSTIYNWNRMCYGITNDKPHLRIECRYISSGPTIVDETANAAFWTGLMHGMPDMYVNIHRKMRFDDARKNFFNAAKMGLDTQFKWLNKKPIAARDLLMKELIPIAKEGLKMASVNSDDISKFMGIIEDRVQSGKTGASWILNSYSRLADEKTTPDGMMVSIAEGIYQRQKVGLPVHKWSRLHIREGTGWESKYKDVGQIMSGDLITVLEDDLLELALNIMQWSNIHHLPVENKRGELKGLITSDHLIQVLTSTDRRQISKKTASHVMIKEVITVSPDMSTIDAYWLMKNNEIDCLPVLLNHKLVGIVTLHDYANLINFFFKKIQGKEPQK